MKITRKLPFIATTVIIVFLVFLKVSDINRARILQETSSAVQEEVTIIGENGVILKGIFLPPDTEDTFTFILLHGLGSVRGEWEPFAQRLEQEGYGYLMLDMRGHGKSIKDSEGNTVNYKYFVSIHHWIEMIFDMHFVAKYLRKKKEVKHIGVIGASLGANVAFNYMAQDKNVRLGVCLSPGWEYAGVKLYAGISVFNNRPLFVAASPGDVYALDGAGKLIADLNKKGIEPFFAKGPYKQHGVTMLDKKLTGTLIKWIKKTEREALR